MSVPTPGPTTRWRCTACGNLTRFDAIRVVRSRDYLHADLAGEQAVEEREVLSEVVEHVTCRWCNAQDSVQIVPRPASPDAAAEPAAGQPAR